MILPIIICSISKGYIETNRIEDPSFILSACFFICTFFLLAGIGMILTRSKTGMIGNLPNIILYGFASQFAFLSLKSYPWMIVWFLTSIGCAVYCAQDWIRWDSLYRKWMQRHPIHKEPQFLNHAPAPQPSRPSYVPKVTATNNVTKTPPSIRVSTRKCVHRINTKVVGVTFDNDDGTNRQDILCCCDEDTPIELQFYRYKGRPAYYVVNSYTDEILGNISADLTQKLYDYESDNMELEAEIIEITGGEDGKWYGCNIRIKIYEE